MRNRWEKRFARWDAACALWEEAARDAGFDPRPWEELAKFHEHRRRDFVTARSVVEDALGLAEDASVSNSAHDFGRDIIPAMVQRDRVFAYRFSGYWRGP